MPYRSQKLPEKGEGGTRYTIKSLKLDLDSANEGKTWLLLPEGYRDRGSGQTYPLPSRRHELQKLATIYVPPHKYDCGCAYIRRAIKGWRSAQRRQHSAVLDMGQRTDKIKKDHENLQADMKKRRRQALEEVEKVRQEAVQQIASLKDLFALGREGIDGQMKAHLEGKKWPEHKFKDCTDEECVKGCPAEWIDGAAFRQCFRMVATAVKGLGLPSEQKKSATDAVMQEVANSLKATQETVALAPESKEETEH